MESLREALTWEVAKPWVLSALLLTVGFVVAKIMGAIARRIAERSGGSEHLAAIVQRMVFYLLLIAVFFGTLNLLGIEPAALLTTAGLLTVALGFAAQTSVANVISGAFLLIDRPFSINDTVRVDGTLGVVTTIDLLSTKIRTFENLMVRFPNEAMLKATIINLSQFPARRLEQRLTVTYNTDLDHLIEVIESAIVLEPLLLDEPEPMVLIHTLAPDGVEISVRAWCVREEFLRARSALTKTVKEAMQQAGVTFALPQRVQHAAPPPPRPEP